MHACGAPPHTKRQRVSTIATGGFKGPTVGTHTPGNEWRDELFASRKEWILEMLDDFMRGEQHLEYADVAKAKGWSLSDEDVRVGEWIKLILSYAEDLCDYKEAQELARIFNVEWKRDTEEEESDDEGDDEGDYEPWLSFETVMAAYMQSKGIIGPLLKRLFEAVFLRETELDSGVHTLFNTIMLCAHVGDPIYFYNTKKKKKKKGKLLQITKRHGGKKSWPWWMEVEMAKGEDPPTRWFQWRTGWTDHWVDEQHTPHLSADFANYSENEVSMHEQTPVLTNIHQYTPLPLTFCVYVYFYVGFVGGG